MPPNPPHQRLILEASQPPKSDPVWVEFLRFFRLCGAKLWGGGGAPPTTLILLRNQRPLAQTSVVRPPQPEPGRLLSQNLQICQKFIFFFSVVVESWRARGGRGGVRQSLRDVSHAQPALPLRLVMPNG